MGKLLVTGGMGHVGFETVKQAVASGRDVVAQYMNTFRAEDAAAFGDKVTWVQCDLSDAYEVAMLGGGHDIEGCIHTAAIPNDTVAFSQPLRTFQSNVTATGLLLETARRKNWRRFLLVSTGSVFQDLPDATHLVGEDTLPTPKTLYGCTKRAAEITVDAYANTYGLSAATIRISWIFGPPLVPRQFDGPRGPVPEYLRRALRGEVVNDPSGGDFAASFTFVPDCAAGLLAAYGADRLASPVYHLGSGENQSVQQVADAVKRAVPGAHLTVGSGTAPWTEHTIMRGPLECHRMQQEFGFTPQHTLNQAVAAFADWMRDHPDSYQKQS